VANNILFRKSEADAEEIDIAKEYFDIQYYRSKCSNLVIPRYSAMPYYEELCEDAKNLNFRLINSLNGHNWVKNFEWYSLWKNFTFESWDDLTISEAPHHIEYVVKGATNSKKLRWNTHMYAKNRLEALKIAGELKSDSLIGSQDIIYRRYEPLKSISRGFNGLNFSDEWRFFFFKNKLLTYGYYWSIADILPKYCNPCLIDFAMNLAQSIIPIDFYTLDIAMKEDGTPILVEVNDGCMSGLSCCNTYQLYHNLSKFI